MEEGGNQQYLHRWGRGCGRGGEMSFSWLYPASFQDCQEPALKQQRALFWPPTPKMSAEPGCLRSTRGVVRAQSAGHTVSRSLEDRRNTILPAMERAISSNNIKTYLTLCFFPTRGWGGDHYCYHGDIMREIKEKVARVPLQWQKNNP